MYTPEPTISKSAQKRITQAFVEAIPLKINSRSKIVVMSDCHRSDGGRADNFLKNQNIYTAALIHYCIEGYTYIELGDGDELWENNNMDDIVEVNREIFEILSELNKRARLYMVYGNHDIIKSIDQQKPPVFKDIDIYQSLLLQHRDSDSSLFLLHGHQADFLNSVLWKLARFLVRKLWRRLEYIGVKDRTSAAKNFKKGKKVEHNLIHWIKTNKQPLMAGHTHRPTLPNIGEPPYYNTGSAVHPQSVTAIEITGNRATLVKWSRKAKTDGVLHVARDILAGPRQI